MSDNEHHLSTERRARRYRADWPLNMMRLAFAFVLLVAISYEPLRWLLTEINPSIDQQVGGVGGVGGLTNMMGPSVNCSTTSGGAQAPYCFQLGVFLGFTPFALVMLALWVLPLMLGALAATVQNMEVRPKKPQGTVEEGGESTAATGDAAAGPSDDAIGIALSGPAAPAQKRCGFEARAMAVWFLFNALWFGLPLAQYCFLSPFYRQSVWTRLLAISLASAYPLSWHLSLVVLPSSGASFLPPLLGISRQQLYSAHKLVARCTVFWAVLHAGGQFAYLIPSGSLGSSFTLAHGENLLFIFGLITIILMLLPIATVAALRKRPSIQPHFRGFHRTVAGLALLAAAAHWWPFALLFCPAVGVAATSMAFAAKRRRAEALFLEIANEVRASAATLAAALGASLVGLAVVWVVRERVMIRAHADTYSPFAFPPLAVAMSYLFARAAAYLVLFNWRMRPKERAAPLLPEGQTLG